MAINPGELAKRLWFGAAYVLVTSVGTIVSLPTTVIVMAGTSALCCYEFLRMAKLSDQHTYIAIGTVTAGLIPIATGLFIPTGHSMFAGMACAFVAGVVMLLRYFGNPEDTIVDVALTLFGYLYTGLTLSAFILLRNMLPGLEGGLLGFLVFGSVCVNDGFAYLGGSAFGKHKFAPHISPKKSWEGVVIGTVASTAWWLLIPTLLPQAGIGYAWAVVGGILCGVAGIIGDLTESHIKRGFDTKDSGDLMPGHGGLLDRSDSLLFVSVVAYAVLRIGPALSGFAGLTL